MSRLLVWTLVVAGLLAALPTLHRRWSEEAQARRVILLVDWKEVRDLSAREISAPLYLLQVLHDAGIQGVLYSPLTLKEAVRGGSDALNTRTISFERSSMAAQAMRELAQRGVQGIQGERSDAGYTLTRDGADFSNLADVEIGYDTHLLALGRDQALDSYLRVNQDPWLHGPRGPAGAGDRTYFYDG